MRVWDARRVRDTSNMESWAETARSPERRHAWDEAISLVELVAECDSRDYVCQDAHLWHMHLLAQAERFDELSELAESDRHARRRLDRALYAAGRYDDLRSRASRGDEYASLLFARVRSEPDSHGPVVGPAS